MHLVERFRRVDADTLRYEFYAGRFDDLDEALDRRRAGDQDAGSDL
jgi:hypothetical protein